MDMVKVIKGLECCQLTYEYKPYEKCPYSNGSECGYCDIDQLHYDAIALIKEQKEEIENTKQTCQSMMEGVCLLKEQEVKTGYWIDSAGNDKCSICGEEYSDLYPDYGNTHFCPNCGAKMEGR